MGYHDRPRTCALASCPERVQPPRVFCDVHWSAIPLPVRRTIGQAWLDGDLRTFGTLVARVAIAVARAEARASSRGREID